MKQSFSVRLGFVSSESDSWLNSLEFEVLIEHGLTTKSMQGLFFRSFSTKSMDCGCNRQ